MGCGEPMRIVTRRTGPSLVQCFGFLPTIVVTPGTTTTGTNGPGVIIGTSGPDVIDGLGGDDHICGFGGDDILYGGDATTPWGPDNCCNKIDGGTGMDTIHGGRNSDLVYGGPDLDFIYGYNGADRLVGGPGDDQLFDGNGQDGMIGEVVDSLVKMFGDEAASPLEYDESDWSDEEWTMGCYGSNVPPGAWTRYGAVLCEPFGFIHWAGTERPPCG